MNPWVDDGERLLLTNKYYHCSHHLDKKQWHHRAICNKCGWHISNGANTSTYVVVSNFSCCPNCENLLPDFRNKDWTIKLCRLNGKFWEAKK